MILQLLMINYWDLCLPWSFSFADLNYPQTFNLCCQPIFFKSFLNQSNYLILCFRVITDFIEKMALKWYCSLRKWFHSDFHSKTALYFKLWEYWRMGLLCWLRVSIQGLRFYLTDFWAHLPLSLLILAINCCPYFELIILARRLWEAT